ncbi:L-ascorbate metabolism protein UlaG (beta-lactamase superfamily) [Archangium gephyra]|uniref:L-ascorbate metabolism protein UlaG (Beta-lactamase superfamily) n=1 Tax=Archangium gephyra TaxID=48 RepID=A0AAC8Q7H3_9BACT|nr:MBL fold metallo-hydrolase [Archangium gephyra]AKJ02422.1 polyketide synthase [Archangium gephyra]REG28653.1 L-ascorbate metabolism protein UlaG (beta-lactamase superfamily) [Archangium gephyra]
MSPPALYLKQNVVTEPLYNQWYAWWFLASPMTAPLFVANLHVKIMESFVDNPAIHVAALKSPVLRGGPYINYGVQQVDAVKALLERTLKEEALSLRYAEAVLELEKLLDSAEGFSLEELYPRVPDLLRGYVELTYDMKNRASPRFFESLLYRSPFHRESSQSLCMRLIHGDARPYVFSTPRLDTQDGSLQVKLPYRHEALDQLYAMRRTPGPVEPVREALGIEPRDFETFSSFFTEQPPRPAPRYDGDGVRVRYFGHACVLIESRHVSVLTDPVISYDFPTEVPRYTYADLPEKIDYVLITHGHADHLMFEPLLQLRHRIGTIVVPANNGGRLADPSLKLMLKQAGFKNVVALSDLESLPLPGGELIGLPFIGEHGDLDIQAKIAHLVRLEGKNLLMAADSNALEPRLYEHVHREVGHIDMMWLGMESEGGPLSWMYGPLLPAPMPRKMDQSRRLNGSNAVRAIEIVQRLKPGQVFIYAMGREPWLGHVMVMGYHENSPQLVESRKLLEYCRERGITADMPYGQAELFLR